MEIDRPDDGDQPVVRRAADRAGSQDVTRSAVQIETRDRETYYADLRATVEAERSAAAKTGDRQADRGADEWRAAAEQFREAWTDHQNRWPRPEREREEAATDSDGGWHGDGGRVLDRDANQTVDRGCERIREIEATTITPAMRRIEAQDPDRELVGLDHRLKGTDRIKEKVARDMLERGDTPEHALTKVPDSIRYTFLCSEGGYASGVRTDVDRLSSHGFELIKLKNSWSSDQYRGINTQWRDVETGQRLEVQFHTRISFDAKQLTHEAYEHLRSPVTGDEEAGELRTLQREICSQIPVPPGAREIPDYPEGVR